MKKTLTVILLISAIFIYGERIIKLGTLAPSNSPWEVGLNKLAAEWEKISDGEIKLKIYTGGVAGDERDMLRKLRLNQLQAVGVTGLGLRVIFPDIMSLQLPMVIRDTEELLYVFEKMAPFYEENLEKRGYKVIIWSIVGWAHFFTQKPVVYPEDLKKQKLWVWQGEAREIQTWKKFGFHVVPLPSTELMTALQSGMVEGFTTNAIQAAVSQWFGLANHMCGMKWAPFVGAIIISKRQWDRFPDEIKPKLLKAVEEVKAMLAADILAANDKSIEVMTKHGLQISEVPEDAIKAWEKEVKRGVEEHLVGNTVSKEAYDMVQGYVKEYREKKKKETE
ncbi:TRAP transporter substrate-binding protein DctP [Candidatus Calescamantes bacterium]|nr:TRAP transporter substrate-binding protein DctP [Candidatus Calescamantes bacterium]